MTSRTVGKSAKNETTLDVSQTAKLRVVVARFGEMDRSKWWNTKGMLAGLGEMAISRGFPRTHLFARARAVFAVAAHRCDEVFDPPGAITLWKLPAEIEDQIDDAWAHWVEDPEPWKAFLQQVNEQMHEDLLETLQSLELVSSEVVEQVKKLRRADDLRSVPLPKSSELTATTIALLAAAFSRGEPGKLAVPYMQLEG
jgi:hypothetical protein